MTWLAAFIGGAIGGALIHIYHRYKLAELERYVTASTNGLVAHHDEVVRGLIERIKQQDDEIAASRRLL